MAYEKLNTPYTWIDEEDGKTTPISAEKLNEKEATLEAIDNRLIDVAEMVEALASGLNEEIEIVTEAIEELQEADNNIAQSISDISDELATLSQDKASAIMETLKGESISAKGTVGGNNIQLLGIYGKCEQDGEPTADNPIEIKKSMVSEVKTHRKNFLKNTTTDKEVIGLKYTVQSDKSVRVVGTTTATDYQVFVGEERLSAGSYILSGAPDNINRLRIAKDNISNLLGHDMGSGFSFTLDEPTTVFVSMRAQSTIGTVIDATYYPMIRKADITDATYEPYTESVATLSSPIELGGIGEVEDVLSSADTKRRFAEKVFNGSEEWISSSSRPMRYGVALDGKPYGSLLCSMAIGTVGYASTESNTCYINQSGYFYINTDFATVDEWKAHLSAKSMTINYELAEPTTEELPTADQIALNSLKSFDGVTYVETDSEVKPTIEAEFVLDTKAYIDRKFAELQAVLTAE